MRSVVAAEEAACGREKGRVLLMAQAKAMAMAMAMGQALACAQAQQRACAEKAGADGMAKWQRTG